MIFWLCNRQPEDWKHVQKHLVETKGQIKHDHKHKHELDLTKLKRKDLERFRKIMLKGMKDPEAIVTQESVVGFPKLIEGIKSA